MPLPDVKGAEAITFGGSDTLLIAAKERAVKVSRRANIKDVAGALADLRYLRP